MQAYLDETHHARRRKWGADAKDESRRSAVGDLRCLAWYLTTPELDGGFEKGTELARLDSRLEMLACPIECGT